MYRQSKTLPDQKITSCPECKSNRFVFTGGKVTCTNCGHLIGKRMNKYGAKRTKAQDGMVRDSKYEASVADELYMRKASGDIKDYESQFKVVMPICRPDGVEAFTVSHKVDFRLHLNDGSYELLEAKGVETSDYKWRRKLLEQIWLPMNKDHTYRVVKQGRR